MKVSIGKGKEVIINHIWRGGKYMSEGWKNKTQIFPEPTKWIDSFELEPVTTASNDDNWAYWKYFNLRRTGLKNWRNPKGNTNNVPNAVDLAAAAISANFFSSLKLAGVEYLLYGTYDNKNYLPYTTSFQVPSGKNIARTELSEGQTISVRVVAPIMSLAYSSFTDTNFVEYKEIPLPPNTHFSSFYYNIYTSGNVPTKPADSTELGNVKALNNSATILSNKAKDYNIVDEGYYTLRGSLEKDITKRVVGQSGVRINLLDSHITSTLQILAFDVNIEMKVKNIKYR